MQDSRTLTIFFMKISAHTLCCKWNNLNYIVIKKTFPILGYIRDLDSAVNFPRVSRSDVCLVLFIRAVNVPVVLQDSVPHTVTTSDRDEVKLHEWNRWSSANTLEESLEIQAHKQFFILLSNLLAREPGSIPESRLVPGLDSCAMGHQCEHICVNSNVSHYCKCRARYFLNPDMKTCSLKRKSFLCGFCL